MQHLKLALVQTPLYWHNADANLAMLEEKLWSIKDSPDIILLPEMFSTGFTMDVEPQAEVMNSKTFRWMKQQAAQHKAVIGGSIIIRDGKEYFNRFLWMAPDGSCASYDKRHLFRMADEHLAFSAGKERLIIQYNGWRICPLVCYDLRFPVWSRNVDKEEGLAYDLLLYVANWPAARINAWDILLKARAVENLCYVAGVNRTGDDGKGIAYNGQSAAYGPKGEEICKLNEEAQIRVITLDKEELTRFRDKFPAYLDADAFMIGPPRQA